VRLPCVGEKGRASLCGELVPRVGAAEAEKIREGGGDAGDCRRPENLNLFYRRAGSSGG
jgi:hypothetical protein